MLRTDYSNKENRLSNITSNVNKNDAPSLHLDDKQIQLNILNNGRNDVNMPDHTYKQTRYSLRGAARKEVKNSDFIYW